MKACILICLLLCGMMMNPVAAPAQEAPTLKEGDVAPELTVGKWIKGEPIEALEPGKIYVLEFWATWCPPCVQVIPHVTALQKQYPEMVFIGVNVWENDTEKVIHFGASAEGGGCGQGHRAGGIRTETLDLVREF